MKTNTKKRLNIEHRNKGDPMKNVSLYTTIAIMTAVCACTDKTSGGSAAETAAPQQDDSARGDSIGVASCDDYIKKYTKCIESAPESVRANMTAAFAQAKAGWVKTASTEMGKNTLDQTCKDAHHNIAPLVRQMGCAW